MVLVQHIQTVVSEGFSQLTGSSTLPITSPSFLQDWHVVQYFLLIWYILDDKNKKIIILLQLLPGLDLLSDVLKGLCFCFALFALSYWSCVIAVLLCPQAFDDCIFAFFAVEMVIKMIALGIFGSKCYLGDTWNRLDFFIVMAGWAIHHCKASFTTIFLLRDQNVITWILLVKGGQIKHR